MAVKNKKMVAKTVTVSVRLDPKLYYLSQLAARKQRRALSSYAEWAIEKALGHVNLFDAANPPITIMQEAGYLWNVDPIVRFVKLAFRYPDLLTHDEQVLWQLIRENSGVWNWQKNRRTHVWEHSVSEAGLDIEELRAHWQTFELVAAGQAEKSKLPTWDPPPDDPSDEDPF